MAALPIYHFILYAGLVLPNSGDFVTTERLQVYGENPEVCEKAKEAYNNKYAFPPQPDGSVKQALCIADNVEPETLPGEEVKEAGYAGPLPESGSFSYEYGSSNVTANAYSNGKLVGSYTVRVYGQ